MAQHRFDVFGQLVVIVGAPGEWSAFVLGTDGRRHRAEFRVPASLTESDLGRYLTDLFHHSASRTQPTVTQLDRAFVDGARRRSCD
jgi:hypothetical protein